MRRMASLTLTALVTVCIVACVMACSEDSSRSPRDQEPKDAASWPIMDATNGGADGNVDSSYPSPAAGTQCAGMTRDDTLYCSIAQCSVDELCFSSILCGQAAADSQSPSCNRRTDTEGDDRCHRTCVGDSDCPDGTKCVSKLFYACSDFNGGPDGRRICF